MEDDPLKELVDQVEAWRAATSSNGLAARLPGLVRRAWVRPDGLDPVMRVSDPENVSAAVTRESLNDGYRTAYLTGGLPNAGRIGEVIAFKTAIDYLGSYERAAQARYAGRARCAAWAAARRRGHGDSEVSSGFGSVMDHCRKTLDASTVSDNAPRIESGGTGG